jgi:type I restriction enzyme S subunit
MRKRISWRTARLGDVAEVRWGDTSTTKAAYVSDGFLAYSATGPDGFLDHFDHEGPGIVVSAIGAQCGKVWFANGRWSCIKNTMYVKGNPGVADTRFLYYVSLAPDFWPRRGAAQPFISQGDARGLVVRLPPLYVQRRIAALLGVYDDLIDVNQRQIAVLEEMAGRLFDEWFVHFRFPGFEQVRLVESKVGLKPDPWEVVPITSLALFRYGKGLPTKHLSNEGPFPVYGASKIIGHHTEFTREHRTLIVGCRGTVGVPLITRPNCFVTNNSFTVDPTYPAAMLWLYCAIQRRGLSDVVGGAAQPQITLEGLGAAQVLSPPTALIDRFEGVVRPMFEQAWVLRDVIAKLQSSRDLLLPRLVSGDLPVAAADQDLEVVA